MPKKISKMFRRDLYPFVNPEWTISPTEELPPLYGFLDIETEHDMPCRECGSLSWTDWLLLPHALFNKVGGYICFDCFVKEYAKTLK